MDEKLLKRVKLYTIIGIVAVILFVFIIRPFYIFKRNEKIMTDAVKRYYQINEDRLPTGRRVSTVSLDTLFKEKYIEKDFYQPLSNKVCDVKKSWGKVTKVNTENKYYIYLDCGTMKSTIDHKGPTIKLKGKKELTITTYDTFKDPGVESVKDNRDGTMNIKDVTVSGKVDEGEVGTYEIKYTAYDSLRNRTTVKRIVHIIQTLKGTVQEETKNGYYTGEDPDNYLWYSNNLYRIMDIDGDNVRIVSAESIGNVNYQSLDKYLKVYYDSLSPTAKENVVKNKYCNMKINNDNKTTTKCSSYTKERETYVYSVTDINKARENEESYLVPSVIDWTANPYDDKKTYATRSFFVGYPDDYLLELENYNIYGVRPVLTIKGDLKIQAGDGTIDDPYDTRDTLEGEPGDKINTRFAGEYVSVDDMLFRIVSKAEDGATKVIAVDPLESDTTDSYTANNLTSNRSYIYNPKQKKNIGYFINNKAGQFVTDELFVKHEIEVPIYKKHVIYGKEVETKKYNVKYFAPDAFDLYNVGTLDGQDYWMINSTKTENLTYIMSTIGSIYDDDEYKATDYHGIKICGYLDKNVAITMGYGVAGNPYVVNK